MKDNKKSKMFLIPLNRKELEILKEAALYGSRNYLCNYTAELDKDEPDIGDANYCYHKHKRFEKIYDRLMEIKL